MSERNVATERRIAQYTRIVCRERDDFIRMRECQICGMGSPYDTKREWNRHLAQHERDGTLTRGQYDAHMEKLIREDAIRMEMSHPDED